MLRRLAEGIRVYLLYPSVEICQAFALSVSDKKTENKFRLLPLSLPIAVGIESTDMA